MRQRASLKGVVLVGLGGAMGSLLRYGLAELMPSPQLVVTLLVNVAGCLALGWFVVWLGRRKWAPARTEGWRLLIGTGLIGGFTTYSAFALETADLIAQGDPWPVFGYSIATVFAGFFAIGVGALLAQPWPGKEDA